MKNTYTLKITKKELELIKDILDYKVNSLMKQRSEICSDVSKCFKFQAHTLITDEINKIEKIESKIHPINFLAKYNFI